VAATEIHGITDDDVTNAPKFRDIAGEILAALSDCVVAAYNIYFDIKFLSYELGQVGVDHEPPHFCLMYMRPLLALGSRCKLEDACRAHNIDFTATHVAAFDVQACGALLECYLEIFQERGILKFADLTALKNYKFLKSFSNDPLPGPEIYGLDRCDQLTPRSQQVTEAPIDSTRQVLSSYWDSLRTVIADLVITEEELLYMTKERKRLGLEEEQVRVLHARAFASAIAEFANDQWLDDQEVEKLRRLHNCLARLGWAAGK
jgi:DNA polymerase III epsilon subunit-like protein